ncbi:MAG TPA: hypothetical protein VJ799_04220, partial [Nitrososphaeraceae archaeon]|nr:hypothetical protein [Nitrososphaeraceae archaeon]
RLEGFPESTRWASGVFVSCQISRSIGGYAVRTRRLTITLLHLVAAALSAKMGRSSLLILLSAPT